MIRAKLGVGAGSGTGATIVPERRPGGSRHGEANEPTSGVTAPMAAQTGAHPGAVPARPARWLAGPGARPSAGSAAASRHLRFSLDVSCFFFATVGGLRGYKAMSEAAFRCSADRPRCGRWGWLVVATALLALGCEPAAPEPEVSVQRQALGDPTIEPAAASFTTAVPAVIQFSGAPGNAQDWVGVYAPAAADAAPALWKYTGGAVDGSLSFLGLPVAAAYEARLFANDSYTRVATSTQRFAVTAAVATVEPAAASFSTASPAVIDFTGAPGNAQDWVGVYAPGTADAAPAMWRYTGGGTAGSLSFLGLQVGTYESRLFVNNTMVKIASSTQQFAVAAAVATVEPAAASFSTASPAVIDYTGAPGNAQDWVGIYAPGTPDAAPALWRYTGGAAAGSLSFLGLPVAAAYEARLFVDNTMVKIASSTQTFAVTAAVATVEPAAASYTRAYPAIIDYTGAPGNAQDWVGVYAPGAADAAPAMWKYTGGGAAGSLGFLGLPVAAAYEARLFVNNSMVKIATSTQTFAVTAAVATVEPAAATYTRAYPAIVEFTGAPGNAHDWVGVYVPGRADAAPAMWKYTGGGAAGSLSFLGLQVGTYEARLFVDNTLVRIATSAQHVDVTAWAGTLAPSRSTYGPGDPVVIDFDGAPGNGRDWIGVFVPAALDAAPVQWHYLDALQSGSTSFAGVAPGSYDARLFVDDSLVKLATSAVFAVHSTCEPTTCAALGFDCGTAPDGCGGTLDCGTCASPRTCGADEPNVCGCAPRACAYTDCGVTPDGCGGFDDCPCHLHPSCGGGL
jgi:hypothetical protein